MLLRSIQGTEWSQFVDYVSPSFLDVIPLSHLFQQGREMVSNAADGGRFRTVRQETEALLRARGMSITIGEAPDHTPPLEELPEDARRSLGQTALEIYFTQLMQSETSILDLRGVRWSLDAGTADRHWFPRPFYLHWQPDFLGPVRDLYTGFYHEDQARFDGALEALGLSSAGDVLNSHFGDGDQRSVRFRAEVFHSSFHEVFVRCRDDGVSLHRNFLALGIYLACLYDLLETLDLEFDVRRAFERSSA